MSPICHPFLLTFKRIVTDQQMMMILCLALLCTLLRPACSGDCYKGGEHMICLPMDYQKYDLPLSQDAVRVYIEVHIKDIPKVTLSLLALDPDLPLSCRYLTRISPSPWTLTSM